MVKRISVQDQELIKKLSKTELDILSHIKDGSTSAEIAQIRNCSRRTVEKHRSNIIRKLGITSSQMALFIWTQDYQVSK